MFNKNYRIMKHNLFIKARWLLCTLFAVFLITPQVWADDVTSVANIVDGATYHIKGQKGATVQYLSFTDAVTNSVKGTGVTDETNAIALKFVKVSDNTYQIITPLGYYVTPNSSNGTLKVSSTATTCTAQKTPL